MKKIAMLFLLGFSTVSAQLTDVSVTFNFDATELITNCIVEPTNGGGITISGSFNNWGAGDAMTKAASGNVYSLVKVLKKKAVGDSTYNFKMRPKASTSALAGWESDPNRSLILSPSSNTTMSLDLGAYQGAITNQCVPTDNVEVTFKVDMMGQRTAGNFNPATDVVKIAGDFTDWATGAKTMTRIGTTDIYQVTEQFTGIKVTVAQKSFKFIHVRGATITWEADPNKSITIPGSGLVDGNSNGFKDYTLRYVFDSSMPPTATDANETPNGTTLSRAFPNPFSNNTQIEYQLASADVVSIKVYDLMGRLVDTLQPATLQTAGTYQLHFDAHKLAAGTYIYTLEGQNTRLTERMTVVK
jgi:Secretion system C-terminal sorting domain